MRTVASNERDRALERLEAPLVEQDRLGERFDAAVGTSTEFGAYVRLLAAGDQVAARKAGLNWVDDEATEDSTRVRSKAEDVTRIERQRTSTGAAQLRGEAGPPVRACIYRLPCPALLRSLSRHRPMPPLQAGHLPQPFTKNVGSSPIRTHRLAGTLRGLRGRSVRGSGRARRPPCRRTFGRGRRRQQCLAPNTPWRSAR